MSMSTQYSTRQATCSGERAPPVNLQKHRRARGVPMNISHPATSNPRVTRIPSSSHSSHIQSIDEVIDFYLLSFLRPTCFHPYPQPPHCTESPSPFTGLYNSMSPPSPMVQPRCLLPSALGKQTNSLQCSHRGRTTAAQTHHPITYHIICSSFFPHTHKYYSGPFAGIMITWLTFV